jgi:serine/threonine-protein kinase
VNPGTNVDGKYRVDRQLGEGGMATVFAATHVNLGEKVAIKVLQAGLADNPTVVERFMREARAAVKLKSEHVIRVLDVGTLPTKQPYIVMEFLDGKDLEILLHERGGPLPYGEVVDYMMQVCEALAEAHAAGIIHRDMKPANCLLTHRHDGMPLIKVLDFGIAKLTLGDDALGPQLTGTQTTMGTPAFMSPEQIRGAKDVDYRGDIWAVGIMLFELMVGKVPFMSDTYARLVMSVMRDPTPPMPNVPPGLVAVVERCLAKERDKRYQSVAELATGLAPFARNTSEAQVLAQRCTSLARLQVARTTPVAGVPAGSAAAARPGAAPMMTPSSVPTPPHGQVPMATPALGQPPHGQHMQTPAHGQPPYTTPAHGQSPYTTPAHGQQPYGQQPPQHMQTGPQPYGQQPGQHMQTGPQPYGQQPGQHMQTGPQPYGQQPGQHMQTGPQPYGQQPGQHMQTGAQPYGQQPGHHMQTGAQPYGQQPGQHMQTGAQPYGQQPSPQSGQHMQTGAQPYGQHAGAQASPTGVATATAAPIAAKSKRWIWFAVLGILAGVIAGAVVLLT